MADYVQQRKETAQPHVPEPVLAVGILQPAGTWGAMGVGQMSGLAGMIALTTDRLYAFNVKPKGRSFKIVDAVGDWDRRDVKVATTPGKLATKVIFDVESTGAHYELEATTIMSAGNFTTVFLEELTRPLD